MSPDSRHKRYISAFQYLSVNYINVSEVAARLAENEETETEEVREVSFSLQVMRYEPGDEDQMHAHAEEEIYHIDAGEATLVTED